MKPVTDFIIKYKKEIIILIIVIIIIVLIKRNWYRVRKLWNPQAEDEVPENLADTATQSGFSEARTIKIESIASKIYTDIEDTPFTGHDYEIYGEANALYDDEIKYMGKYYRDYLTGGQEKMSDAIKSQSFWWSSGPADLANKLTGYNL
jgi:hypothetical protein